MQVQNDARLFDYLCQALPKDFIDDFDSEVVFVLKLVEDAGSSRAQRSVKSNVKFELFLLFCRGKSCRRFQRQRHGEINCLSLQIAFHVLVVLDGVVKNIDALSQVFAVLVIKPRGLLFLFQLVGDIYLSPGGKSYRNAMSVM